MTDRGFRADRWGLEFIITRKVTRFFPDIGPTPFLFEEFFLHPCLRRLSRPSGTPSRRGRGYRQYS